MDWKNKLDDVDSLPGETLLDKNATWQKLHNRLRQKPRLQRPVWYWAAAACLLLLIIIPVVVPHKKQDNLVKTNTVKTQPAKVIAPEILPLKENTLVVAESVTINKKTVQEHLAKVNYNKPRINVLVKIENGITGGFDEKYSLQQALILSPAEAGSHFVTALTLPPAKKKLKVVHINELGDPGEETPNIAHSYEHHSFEFKLINQEVNTSPPLPSNTTGFTFFKSKNIPSN